MRPLAFVMQIGGAHHPVYSFGLALACAWLLGAALFLRRILRQGADPGAGVALIGAATAGGAAGAYGLALLVHGAQGAAGRGGLVVYGGFGGALLATWGLARALDVPCRQWLAWSVLPLACAQAVGRIGCLLGGCCFGRPAHVPWAVRYAPEAGAAAAEAAAPHAIAMEAFSGQPWDGVTRHPAPLYEAAWVLGAAWLCERFVTERHRFSAYLCLYASGRFVLEFLRADGIRGRDPWLALSTSQWLSAGLMLALVPPLLRAALQARRSSATS